ncbi:hypothetical protein V0288_04800 [Pannus brasiliensis CCIBt3594]|uniref:Uncharacterized protein n=1 Tax=Pannus brasiliensis CCIBt3594 TaxID=1427578 RepID=A0AAW9QHE4_9CHRO
MFLLLPKLKSDSDVRPSDKAGKWDAQAFKTFDDVASSLDYKSPGQVKSVSSVPTIWARPLSMEMALHNKAYPIHRQMIEQWQGMLAAIALAEVRRFPLAAQLLELGELRHRDPFARSLYELLPNPPSQALYFLEGKNPWQDIYVFLWDGKPVGMSSPSTIVVPSEEGWWETLPWWNRTTRGLEAPHSYLNASEKALLWRWLENLNNELNGYSGQKNAQDRMRGLLQEFRDSLGSYPGQTLSLSSNPQFFGVPLNRGVLNALNRPVKAEPKESSVRLIASESKKGRVPDLLIIDPEIARSWDRSPQDIWIYQDQTLASLDIRDLLDKKILWKEIRWIQSEDLFTPEFYFIDQDDALPGAFLPDNTHLLIFKGQELTPLLPINPILLDYFTPEDLMRRLQFTPLNGKDGPVLRVSLDLPLSGIKNDERNPENFRIFKDYPIKEENALTQVPVLEIWPNFRTESWKEYYAFYYDLDVLASANPADKTFQISLPEAKEPHIFQEGKGSYQLTRLENFPPFIACQDRSRNSLGLILLKTPATVFPESSWKVGVDFGTSFTNVYINRKGDIGPLPLESLHLKVTEVQADTRLPALFEYFVPENFIPPEKPLPLSSVLTTRKSNNVTKERPIYDGRIYIPDRARFNPLEGWIETDLKWTNITLNRLFLKHLALHITALAAKNGIQQIQWSLSYPSAFSRADKTRYARNWKDLTAELQTKTGVTQISPEQDNLNYFRTESLATAQYFADREGLNLVNTTCIDMGGGTSDISIWEDGNDRFQLVHQCSVQLAGRHLFSQFLELNPRFLVEKFEIDAKEWQGLKEGNFHAKLDVLLRLESENWLKKRDFLEEDPEFQGLLRLMAIGTAGLYYYVGILLQVLYAREKYSRNEITPVYIGGNGSRLLNWLAVGGRFDRHAEVNELFSRMMSEASGFPDTNEISYISERPKDEVACGLVLDRTPLGGLTSKKPEPVIAGEDCVVNGQPIEWKDYLELEGDIKGFDIPRLTEIPQFLNEFNSAVKELDIQGLKPLPAFKNGELESSYKDRLWREVQKELRTNLIQIRGDSENIRIEPPFILGLKALLRVLGKEWAGK